MRMIVLYLALTLFTTIGFSQNFHSPNTISIISSQGGVNKTKSILLTWTLGENIVETSYINKGIITQGFHQSFFDNASTLGLNMSSESKFKPVVFPNPVNHKLHINLGLNTDSKFNVKIYDLTGRLTLESFTNIKGPEFWIDVVNFKSGIYILKISNENESFIEVYKIIKN
ncbi:T9SS type A sorting domain-containing protein [Mariniflexile rhizosphaerae]|uniref:T9SS type A sorting domain-containing protein n=2 Tax=Mariniflexile TaxID=527198 RepID=UPI000E3D422C|nr:T9SS type A sorting domain-containing protein [Mariniflexile sp. TRM1-10]